MDEDVVDEAQRACSARRDARRRPSGAIHGRVWGSRDGDSVMAATVSRFPSMAGSHSVAKGGRVSPRRKSQEVRAGRACLHSASSLSLFDVRVEHRQCRGGELGYVTNSERKPNKAFNHRRCLGMGGCVQGFFRFQDLAQASRSRGQSPSRSSAAMSSFTLAGGIAMMLLL